ncbi:MAG: hypothetical protein U0165_18535 [Polyangiaceae bacterium]
MIRKTYSTALVLGLFLGAVDARADGDPPPAAPSEEVPVELSVTPASSGQWTMTLANNGKVPARVFADARMLWFEVVGVSKPDPKKPKQLEYLYKGKMPTCRMPDDMRPKQGDPSRLLILKPGEKYTEKFDLYAFCAGKAVAAEVAPGALLYPHYGWVKPKANPKKNVVQQAPFIVESPVSPEDFTAEKDLEGDMVQYPAAAEVTTSTSKRDELVADPGAPKIELSAKERGDASGPRDVSVTVTAKNVGKRPALVHLRGDDYSFEVITPEGKRVGCSEGAEKRGAVREFFSTLGGGKSRTTTLLLNERCPSRTFDRPGVYEVTAKLVMREAGDEYNLTAILGSAKSRNSTKIRVRTGRNPYHLKGPKAESINPSTKSTSTGLGTSPPKSTDSSDSKGSDLDP